MSHKGRLNQPVPKITIGVDNTDKYYTFNFCFLTDDKHYSLKYFDSNNREVAYILQQLFDKLKIIGETPILEFVNKPKDSGLEYIERSSFKTKTIFKIIDKKFQATKETKYLVMRFNSQKCRIICKQQDTVLYILGLDFDLSTYNH